MDETRRARRSVVTGAGSGLGRAIAERLAGADDQVIGTVRSPERAAALSEKAREAGLRLRFVPLELGALEQVRATARALEAEGGVDLLVHNAGFGLFGAIEQTDDGSVAHQFAVNLFGPLELTRLLLPGLRARRGRVIWIGSLAGRLSLPFQAHYSATKAAIASVSDAMRLELAPLGVAVTCVEPGDFSTGFTDARQRAGADDPLYRERIERCLQAVEQQERDGAQPALVARAVEKLSRLKSPPARYPVGRWANTLCLLHRLLPDAVRESVVRRLYRV